MPKLPGNEYRRAASVEYTYKELSWPDSVRAIGCAED